MFRRQSLTRPPFSLRFKQLNAATAVAYSQQRLPHPKDFQMTPQYSPHSDDDDTPPVFAERTGPRVIIDPISGYSVVTRQPGAPMVTNEEVKRLLEDFP